MVLNFIINIGLVAAMVIGITYIGLLIAALYLIIKHEKGLMLLVWLLVVLSLPFLGSIIYLIKFLLAGKIKLQS